MPCQYMIFCFRTMFRNHQHSQTSWVSVHISSAHVSFQRIFSVLIYYLLPNHNGPTIKQWKQVRGNHFFLDSWKLETEIRKKHICVTTISTVCLIMKTENQLSRKPKPYTLLMVQTPSLHHPQGVTMLWGWRDYKDRTELLHPIKNLYTVVLF